MMGRHHVVGGLGALAVGRAVVVSAEVMPVITLSDAVRDVLSYTMIATWCETALSWATSGIHASASWVRQMLLPWDTMSVLVVGVLIFVIGTLLPDIDHTRSLVGRLVSWDKSALRHRGWTHSIWVIDALVLLSVVTSPTYGSWLWAWLALGIIVHDVMDAGSVAGWVWYYPLLPSRWQVIERDGTRIVVTTRRRSALGRTLRYTAGSVLERVYVWLIVVLGVVMTAATW